MKIRIGAIGGLSGIGRSHALDELDASDALAPPAEEPALSPDEAFVLDELTTVSAIHALDPPATSTGAQRVEAKTAIVPVSMLAYGVGPFERMSGMASSTTVGIQAKQGVPDAGPEETIAKTTGFGPIRRHGAGTPAAIRKIVDVAPPATPPLDIGLLRPTFEPAAPATEIVGSGHPGNTGSQSDEEQSQAPDQIAWAEEATVPDKVLLTSYQAPLFNRRLETNGVDDALLLASTAALREALTPGHVGVPPVQAVVPVVAMAPIVPEKPDASASLETTVDTDMPQVRRTWPHVAQWRRLTAASMKLLPEPAVAASAATRRNRNCHPWPQPRARHRTSFMMSGPRSTGVAECAPCWVRAGRLAPGTTQLSCNKPAREGQKKRCIRSAAAHFFF